MKKVYYLFLCSMMLTLAACTPPAQQVMPPLTYSNQIAFHDSQKADLYWQTGSQVSSEAPPTQDYNDGIGGMIINSVVNNEMRSAHPGDFTYTYGKAQQAVFMTSLKNTLVEQHAFKDVELITDPKAAKPQDVLITVNFKETRVLGHEKNYQIILDTELTIKNGNKPPFKRTYLVESKDSSVFSTKSFKDQQTDVSQQLLNKVIAGMTQWYTQGH